MATVTRPARRTNFRRYEPPAGGKTALEPRPIPAAAVVVAPEPAPVAPQTPAPLPVAKPGMVRLTLTIGETHYWARVMGREAGDGATRVIRLKTPSGDIYDVAQLDDGWHQCDCADWIFARDGHDPDGCKHVRACVAVGLLAPHPIVPGLNQPLPQPPADEPWESRDDDREATEDRPLDPPQPQQPKPHKFGEGIFPEDDDTGEYPAQAPAEPKPAEQVDAVKWATTITGKLWDVATKQQRDWAVELLNRDYIVGLMITPVGPSIDELKAAYAEKGGVL